MITYQSQAGSPVVELRVEGRVTDAELVANVDRLRTDLEVNGKSRLIEIIENFTGIEPAAIWSDVRLGLPLAQKVERVAVVADQAWIRTLTHLGPLFTRAEIRSFAPAELDEARRWIGMA